MSGYWIYEDMTVHTAVLHRADCRYCNNGAGMGRGRIERDSRWVGRSTTEGFASADQARSLASIQADSTLRNCRVCMG